MHKIHTIQGDHREIARPIQNSNITKYAIQVGNLNKNHLEPPCASAFIYQFGVCVCVCTPSQSYICTYVFFSICQVLQPKKKMQSEMFFAMIFLSLSHPQSSVLARFILFQVHAAGTGISQPVAKRSGMIPNGKEKIVGTIYRNVRVPHTCSLYFGEYERAMPVVRGHTRSYRK